MNKTPFTMKRKCLFLAAIAFVLFSFNEPEHSSKGKWVTLFNGKDLTGWKVKISGYELGNNFGNTFRVEDGILRVKYDQYGALYYDKSYKNYRLKVEYRFVGETTPGAPPWGFRDSGVNYHCQPPSTVGLNQSFPVCLECNLQGGNGKDERPVGEICANGIYVEVNGKRNESYCTPPTVKRTFHGDQWVTLEIDVRDKVFRHFINGEEILKFENPKYDPKHELGRTFIIGNDDAVKQGYISLQSNSHPIDFRKIEIMEYE
jgi:hypothetical protein